MMDGSESCECRHAQHAAVWDNASFTQETLPRKQHIVFSTPGLSALAGVGRTSL